jgi:predicted RNA-binding protein with TRAM domain
MSGERCVSGLVVFFSKVQSGNTVRVRSEFVKLDSSLVGFVWHSLPLR